MHEPSASQPERTLTGDDWNRAIAAARVRRKGAINRLYKKMENKEKWISDDLPKGESRSVNIGTKKNPCWALEGPARTAEDIAWTRSIVDALHPIENDTRKH